MNKIIQNLINTAFIGDAHLDLAYDLLKKREYRPDNVLENDYYPLFKKSGLNLIISSIFIDNEHVPELALRQGLRQLELLLESIEKSHHFCLINTKKSLADLKGSKKIGIVVCLEGIEPILNDLSVLSIFKRLGLSGVGLCWARRNYAADGSQFIRPARGYNTGLSSFGYELLDYMKNQNLFLDLSHINDQGFSDALDVVELPPMISHTNARMLNDTDRNITDVQIKKIIDKKGFLGVNAMNFTVSDGKSISEDSTGYIQHIKHILNLGGEDVVGFGFDFNDYILPYVPPQQLMALPRKPFDCIKGYDELPQLIELLYSANIPETILYKIMGENLFNYLMKVLPCH